MISTERMMLDAILLSLFPVFGGGNHSRHCSPPTGSVDGSVVVEDGGGQVLDLTTLTWQVALGSTLCYRSGLGRER